MSTAPRLVVGGGVSGIAAAHYLKESGLEVALIEQGELLGGRMAPAPFHGRSIELGGKNIGRRYRLFREFAVLNNQSNAPGKYSSQHAHNALLPAQMTRY